jgi:HTH-type transcriptional regulator / antitoxin HigA
MMDRKPAEVFHPGEHLRDELRARGYIGISALSDVFGIYFHDIFNLIMESVDLTEEIATVLADKLGTSTELWLNLQRAWDERSK